VNVTEQAGQSPEEGYTKRYVAFLDILGFSRFSELADEHPDWRAYLKSIIEQLHNTLPKQHEQSGFRFVQFSDCIVLSARRDPTGLWAVIYGVNMIISNMLTRGILMRGGLAAGGFFHDDRVMFGPALLRAHSYDKSGAPPHVAVHNDVIKDMESEGMWPGARGYLNFDPWDLSPILHTLYQYEHYDAIPRVGQPALEGEAATIATIIAGQAYNPQSAAPVRAKWRWMQDYWNRTVAAKGRLPPSPHRELGPVSSNCI
jgi:hypothetical protein